MKQDISRIINQKGFASAILLVLSLVVVAALSSVGTYLFLESKKTPVSTVVPVPSITSTPNAVQDKTADWKTYVNESEGYSIKYPTDRFTRFSCSDVKGLLLYERLPTHTGEILESPACATDNTNLLNVWTSDEPFTKEPSIYYFHEDQEGQLVSDEHMVSKEQITVSGIGADKYVITYTGKDTDPSLNRHTIILMSYKNRYYRIFLGLKEFESVFDQMLSTLKFTN